MLKSSILLILSVLSVVNCQFFYNVEDRQDVAPPEIQNYDSSANQYNAPLAPGQVDAEPQSQAGQRRTRIRARSRNYQSDPNYNDPQQQEYNQPAARQEMRQVRRRERQYFVQPPSVQPPRVYSPSLFENIGLGEAPSGVYIPHNSFLNVLKNQRDPVSYPISQPVVTAPQITSYAQPSVNYDPQPRFFVQPPSDDEPRQTNLILPVSRPRIVYGAQANAQDSVSQNVPDRTVRTSRRSRQRVNAQADYGKQPTVDIDSFREFTDDVTRDDIQVMPKVEYAPVAVQQNRRSQNRRRPATTYTFTPAPRVYSPSVFEKVGLGEAPSGIYVPEDSLLNVLRNPSAQPVSRREPQQLQAQQTYNAENNYLPEVIEEEQYQPPPPPRRRPPQRNRQPQSRRQTERRRYMDVNSDQTPVQRVPSSSQPRNQRRNEDYEEYAPVQQAQPQRRPASTPRQQSQVSSSPREESSSRKAKLIVATLPEDTDGDEIPGEAGTDYPTLHVIPKTTFSCSQQSHNGYYADVETSCQVFHLCQSGGVQSSFLCSNGTIFSQEKFSCQWWYKVNCSDAPNFYIKNDELYKVPEKKERKRN